MIERFVDLFEDCTKQGTKIKTDEYKEVGKYIIVDQGQNDIAGYTDEINGVYEDIPAIVFGDHTRVIKYIDKPFFLGADGVKLLKCKRKNTNYKYLYYALKNAKIPNTGYNRHYKWLKETKIIYPDPIRQQRIVDVLDKIEKIMLYRKKQIDRLDDLIKSRFVEMFGGIEDSEKYPYVTIDSFTSVASGGTPDRKNAKCWQGGNIRWVKTTELQNNIIMETEEKITQFGIDNSSARMIPANSVLIAMYGQGKTRGMTGYLAVECTTNQACACILPSDNVDQKYLWQYMILSYDKLRNLAKGGNQPNLNAGIIKKFPVLMPPLNLQRQFSAFAHQIDKSKTAVQKSLDETQMLFDSLMQQYFG